MGLLWRRLGLWRLLHTLLLGMLLALLLFELHALL